MDPKPVLLVALESFLWYLVFLNPLYFNGVSKYIITTRIMSKLCLSSKQGSMSSPREAELQSPLPKNNCNLLSLQETLLGCRWRMPGNLNVFYGFLSGSRQVTNRTSHSQDMHENQLGIRLLITTVQRLTIWCTDGELIMLADSYIKHIYING